ncbi:MAG: (Fe-S)-binding protein [Nitrospirae bacterium]|nr:(Fe-S)-binding protein [Nitrospirota bacterium]
MKILVAKGYEVVILKGEVCCGAPLRSFGLDEEAAQLARKNIELFSKLRTDAVISMCPTCTMTIKDQYPALVGDSIDRVMDINEFFISNDITADLAIADRALTYHDPCHLRYGLGITEEPRKVIKNIQGAHLIEMQNPGECCGFGGFFSLDFRDLSRTIGEKKIRNILNTGADTVVTSCPGCMMQLEDLNRQANSRIRIMHIVELVAEGMHTKKDHFS